MLTEVRMHCPLESHSYHYNEKDLAEKLFKLYGISFIRLRSSLGKLKGSLLENLIFLIQNYDKNKKYHLTINIVSQLIYGAVFKKIINPQILFFIAAFNLVTLFTKVFSIVCQTCDLWTKITQKEKGEGGKKAVFFPSLFPIQLIVLFLLKYSYST